MMKHNIQHGNFTAQVNVTQGHPSAYDHPDEFFSLMFNRVSPLTHGFPGNSH